MSINNNPRISSDSAQREPLLPKKGEAPTPVSRMQLLFTRNVYVGDGPKSVASIVKETGLSKREVLQLHNEHKLAALYQQTYPLFEGEVQLTEVEMAQAIGVTINELQEMGKVDVEMRLLAKETGVPLKDIRKMSKEKRFSLMRENQAELKQTGYTLAERRSIQDPKHQQFIRENQELAGRSGYTVKELREMKPSQREQVKEDVKQAAKYKCTVKEYRENREEIPLLRRAIREIEDGDIDLEIFIKETGFGLMDVMQLREAGKLNQGLYEQAKSALDALAGSRRARQGVEQAMGRFFDDKNISVEKKKLAPEQYQQAYGAIENLAKNRFFRPDKTQLAAFLGKRLRIFNPERGDYLAEGAFGTVTKVNDLAKEGDQLIVKTAKLRPEEQAKGAAVLAHLHADQEHIAGIMDNVQIYGDNRLIGEIYSKGELTAARLTEMSEDQRRQMITETLFGLVYAHSKGVYHRDIKPENMLVDADNHVVLADWDGAVRPDQAPTSHLGTFTSVYHMQNEAFALKASTIDTPQARDDLAKADALALGLSYIVANVGFDQFKEIIFAHIDALDQPNGRVMYFQSAASLQVLLDHPFLWASLENRGVTQEQIAVIRLMIQPDISKRITPQQAKELLDKQKAVEELQKIEPLPSQPVRSRRTPSELFSADVKNLFRASINEGVTPADLKYISNKVLDRIGLDDPYNSRTLGQIKMLVESNQAQLGLSDFQASVLLQLVEVGVTHGYQGHEEDECDFCMEAMKQAYFQLVSSGEIKA